MRLLVLVVLALIFACSKTEEPTLLPHWAVTETGFGPLHIGMTVADAREAMGSEFMGGGHSEQCYFLRPQNEPAGVLFMVVDGRIARVDVTDGSISTGAGARIGDSEARIEMVYPGRVERLPHKYTDGYYLIVGSDKEANRIIFETDGEKVTRYRAGKKPEVDWVEGCS